MTTSSVVSAVPRKAVKFNHSLTHSVVSGMRPPPPPPGMMPLRPPPIPPMVRMPPMAYPIRPPPPLAPPGTVHYPSQDPTRMGAVGDKAS